MKGYIDNRRPTRVFNLLFKLSVLILVLGLEASYAQTGGQLPFNPNVTGFGGSPFSTPGKIGVPLVKAQTACGPGGGAGIGVINDGTALACTSAGQFGFGSGTGGNVAQAAVGVGLQLGQGGGGAVACPGALPDVPDIKTDCDSFILFKGGDRTFNRGLLDKHKAELKKFEAEAQCKVGRAKMAKDGATCIEGKLSELDRCFTAIAQDFKDDVLERQKYIGEIKAIETAELEKQKEYQQSGDKIQASLGQTEGLLEELNAPLVGQPQQNAENIKSIAQLEDFLKQHKLQIQAFNEQQSTLAARQVGREFKSGCRTRTIACSSDSLSPEDCIKERIVNDFTNAFGGNRSQGQAAAGPIIERFNTLVNESIGDLNQQLPTAKNFSSFKSKYYTNFRSRMRSKLNQNRRLSELHRQFLGKVVASSVDRFFNQVKACFNDAKNDLAEGRSSLLSRDGQARENNIGAAERVASVANDFKKRILTAGQKIFAENLPFSSAGSFFTCGGTLSRAPQAPDASFAGLQKLVDCAKSRAQKLDALINAEGPIQGVDPIRLSKSQTCHAGLRKCLSVVKKAVEDSQNVVTKINSNGPFTVRDLPAGFTPTGGSKHFAACIQTGQCSGKAQFIQHSNETMQKGLSDLKQVFGAKELEFKNLINQVKANFGLADLQFPTEGVRDNEAKGLNCSEESLCEVGSSFNEDVAATLGIPNFKAGDFGTVAANASSKLAGFSSKKRAASNKLLELDGVENKCKREVAVKKETKGVFGVTSRLAGIDCTNVQNAGEIDLAGISDELAILRKDLSSICVINEDPSCARALADITKTKRQCNRQVASINAKRKGNEFRDECLTELKRVAKANAKKGEKPAVVTQAEIESCARIKGRAAGVTIN